MLWLYICRNFAKIVGLECPEPLANLYNRSYFRATWVTTALDAGFWTAMRIRKKWLRDLASIVFSVYYLFAAEQADEKVRKVRGTLTVDHLRVSWNKSTTPYLSFFTRLLRPKLARYPPRAIRIPRPPESSYREAINAWLYFDGPLSALKNHTKVVLDIPGGGFVAMSPRTSDDKLLAWAGKTGLPILSLDYKKAPEFPYPYALNECYDVYHTLVSSRGRCVGLAGGLIPRIILTGDSAGGNFATGVVLMILQSAADADTRGRPGQETLPTPEGLVLIYPGLDMNIGNWMTDEQMSLIQDRRMRKTNKNVLRRKSEDYYKLAETPHPSDDEEEKGFSPEEVAESLARANIASPTEETDVPETPLSTKSLSTSPDTQAAHLISPVHITAQKASISASKPTLLKTRLAMSSMISYFNDRILTPEMMRAMIILYVGPHNRPDFSTDFLLSPLLAPEALLARFPKTYFLTGERDPLVDDTVIFAGRLRSAKYNSFVQKKELSLLHPRAEFNETDHVEVQLIPGISHGFLQFVNIFPEGWRHIFRCATWMEEIYASNEPGGGPGESEGGEASPQNQRMPWTSATANGSMQEGFTKQRQRHHRRLPTSESSGDEFDRPLEMTRPSARSANDPTTSNSTSNPLGPSTSPNRKSATNRRRAGTKLARRNGDREELTNANGNGDGNGDGNENGDGEPGGRGGKPRRQRSLVSLASEDDLLGRRMKGLAGGLMGMTAGTTNTP